MAIVEIGSTDKKAQSSRNYKGGSLSERVKLLSATYLPYNAQGRSQQKVVPALLHLARRRYCPDRRCVAAGDRDGRPCESEAIFDVSVGQ